MSGLKPTSRNGTARLRPLHRWLGIGALVFLLLLTVSGVALNHAAALNLDRNYLTAAWLLDWYGLTVPAPTVSFAAGDRRLTLVGERLYVDTHEIARGIEAVTGAAMATGERFAVATESELLLFSPGAELLDRIDLAGELGSPIDGLAQAGQGAELALRSAGRTYRYDAPLAQLRPVGHDDETVAWSMPSSVPAETLAGIARAYRGDGLTFERLLYDLHSGRVLGRTGVVLMDLAGVAIAGLAVTGLLLWLKGGSSGPNGRRR